MSNNPAQIRNRGINVLLRELGPVDTVRFLQQFDAGYGNYTEERQEILKHETLESVSERIMQKQKRERPQPQ
ncbi:MAG: hypothetical protein LBU65_03790 [Planctomycetaceae bacterium]|jgi:hypothetical protein|nr:hypothetical protein [Planctomycetaceae bacterium]